MFVKAEKNELIDKLQEKNSIIYQESPVLGTVMQISLIEVISRQTSLLSMNGWMMIPRL